MEEKKRKEEQSVPVFRLACLLPIKCRICGCCFVCVCVCGFEEIASRKCFGGESCDKRYICHVSGVAF